MVLEAIIADIRQQFLQVGDLDHAEPAKRLERIVG